MPRVSPTWTAEAPAAARAARNDGSAILAALYDAGYYGYAWADAISADMASVFENSPGGYFDVNTGLKLRNEIYAVGGSRDPGVSIEKFLGRPQSNQPFLKKIGIATK